MEKKRITVFGGSVPLPGEPAYEEALKLGVLIARSGYIVQTGGYSGTMEAVSRGAFEAGGHTVGITCFDLEVWRPLPPNRWVMEEMRFKTLRERLYALIDHADAAIALPGGIGTLAEIAAMWSSLQTEEIVHCPLILVGAGWRTTLDTMLSQLSSYVRADHRKLLTFAPNVEAAFQLADRHLRG